MKNPLTQQSKPCSAVPHAFNELQLIHFSLDDAIVVDKRQSCLNCCFFRSFAACLSNVPYEGTFVLMFYSTPVGFSRLVQMATTASITRTLRRNCRLCSQKQGYGAG